MKAKYIILFSLIGSLVAGGGVATGIVISHNKNETSTTITDDNEIQKIYKLYRASGGDLSYEDWLRTIKGEKGDTGLTGPQGPAGQNGQDGKDGVSVLSIAKTGSDGLVDIYTITYSNNSTSTFTITNGTNGANGKEVEFAVIDTYLSYRYVGDEEWISIYDIKALSLSCEHNYTTYIEKYPTCLESGKAISICDKCDDVIRSDIPALGHEYKEEIIEPSPGFKGYTLHTCIRCGDNYKDNYVDELPYNYYELLEEINVEIKHIEEIDLLDCKVDEIKTHLQSLVTNENIEISYLKVLKENTNTCEVEIRLTNESVSKVIESKEFYISELVHSHDPLKEEKDYVSSVINSYKNQNLKPYGEKEVDIILFAGQSNSCGRATLEDNKGKNISVSQDVAFTFKNTGNTICSIEEPLTYNGTSGYGYIPSFLTSYYNTTGHRVCACFMSVGGTSLNKFTPYVLDGYTPTSTKNKYYTNMVNYVNNAKEQLTNSGYTYKNIYLVWCQGENEGLYYGQQSKYSTEYEASLTNYDDKMNYYAYSLRYMIDSLKTDIGLDNTFLIRIGYCKNGSDNDPIIKAQTSMSQQDNDIVLASTEFAGAIRYYNQYGQTVDMMRDPSHFYLDMYNEVGNNAGLISGIFVNTSTKMPLVEYRSLIKNGTETVYYPI